MYLHNYKDFITILYSKSDFFILKGNCVFLRCVITKALSLMGSPLASSGFLLESAGTGFTGHGGSF